MEMSLARTERKRRDFAPRRRFSLMDSAAAAAKSLQSCPTLCDPIDSSPPGSSILGIFQARVPEWVLVSSKSESVSCSVMYDSSVTPWTIACQAPLSMEFSGKNTEVDSHSILQGIFPIQAWNPDLPHCRWILYHLSHQGSPGGLHM